MAVASGHVRGNHKNHAHSERVGKQMGLAGRITGRIATQQKEREKRLRRLNLQIDFLEFGWDWILAPRGYNAYYCAGQCTPGMAARVQHALMAEGKGASLCCAPDSVADMRIVYIDDEGRRKQQTAIHHPISGLVHARIVPNMIVQRCGCS